MARPTVVLVLAPSTARPAPPAGPSTIMVVDVALNAAPLICSRGFELVAAVGVNSVVAPALLDAPRTKLLPVTASARCASSTERAATPPTVASRSEEHTSELQSH